MLLLYYVVSNKSLHTPTEVSNITALIIVSAREYKYRENVMQFTHFHVYYGKRVQWKYTCTYIYLFLNKNEHE